MAPGDALGFAGFGGNNHNRSALLFTSLTLFHYPGAPDDLGHFWTESSTNSLTLPRGADIGGPLFLQRGTDHTREPIGVLAGLYASSDASSADLGDEPGDDHEDPTVNGADLNVVWTDLTREPTATWIRDQMRATVTDHWRAQHGVGADYWKGDVDYTGPCQTIADSDCDHWYDAHDNCPTVANIDQADANDNGIGDACDQPPAFAPRCVPTTTCGSEVYVDCQPLPYSIRLEQHENGTWGVLGQADGPYTSDPFFDAGVQPASQIELRACSVNASGATCSASLFVAPDHSPCGAPGGGPLCTSDQKFCVDHCIQKSAPCNWPQ